MSGSSMPCTGMPFGGGFKTGDLTDCVDQRLAMMRTGAAHQCSIDIEKNQIGQDSILRYEAARITPVTPDKV